MRGSLNINISGKTDQVCLGQNGFFGIHTSFVKVFRSKFKAIGAGGGRAGGGSPPPKF